MSRLFAQDIIFNQRRTTQEVAYIVASSTFQTFQGVLGYFALSVSELAIMIGILSLFSVFNIWLTIFIIFFFVSVLFILNRKMKEVIDEKNKVLIDSDINARIMVQEALNSYREVFVSQKIEPLVKTLVSNLRNSIDARASLTWASLMPKYVLDTSLILGIAIIGGFSYLVYSPEEALTIVSLFVLGGARILPSLLRFNTGIQGVQNSRDASNRLFKLVQELEDCEGKIENVKTTFFLRDNEECLIEVNSLSFRYQGAADLVLDNISFNVKKGEFLAIVGPSGSGKSTLVDLLIGVIKDPSESIRVGGLAPGEQIGSNPGLIGYVPQNVSIFNRSLLENVALGVPPNEIDQVSFEGAIESAALREVVNELPLGSSTIMGENGFNVSGGQKQRIGIARALYSNPEILILDEATSALDAETEYQISQTLSSLAGDLTMIVVAHRLATVRRADRILYLGGSGFSAVGSFEELRIQVPNFDIQAKLLGL
jgi:ABC-type multidrug transport system fused ATPase/permease subunit